MKTQAAIAAFSATLHRRSLNVLGILENRLAPIVAGWVALILVACFLRILISPLPPQGLSLDLVMPYVLLVGAPAASLLLALRWFSDGEAMPQPTYRLARAGRWQDLAPSIARRHPLYGTSGIMVSLLVGMLLNIPVRAAEYLMTMPAIGAAAPEWLSVLHFWMTLDAVLVSSLYAVCFAAAIRKVPLFPRLLLLVWLVDIAMQLLIAQGAVATGLPPSVAAPLHVLLEKNITKVMISMGLWLPYLLLSTRVNVTYRSRIPA